MASVPASRTPRRTDEGGSGLLQMRGKVVQGGLDEQTDPASISGWAQLFSETRGTHLKEMFSLGWVDLLRT